MMGDNTSLARGKVVEVWQPDGVWGASTVRFGIVLGDNGSKQSTYHEVLVGTQKLWCYKLQAETFFRTSMWDCHTSIG